MGVMQCLLRLIGTVPKPQWFSHQIYFTKHTVLTLSVCRFIFKLNSCYSFLVGLSPANRDCICRTEKWTWTSMQPVQDIYMQQPGRLLHVNDAQLVLFLSPSSVVPTRFGENKNIYFIYLFFFSCYLVGGDKMALLMLKVVELVPLHNYWQHNPLIQGAMGHFKFCLWQILTLPSECRSRSGDSSDQAWFSDFLFTKFSEHIQIVASVCSSQWTGVAPGVVFCCCSPTPSRFRDGLLHILVGTNGYLSYSCLLQLQAILP